jgi:hypothetical protein
MESITKCGNCGSELKRVTVSGGKWRWIPFILVLLFIASNPWRRTLFKGDFTKDLVISEVESRRTDFGVELLGLITNNGKKTWQNVHIEAEFYDENGHFIDEGRELIWSVINGHAQERFKIQIRSKSPYLDKLDDENAKVAVKVSSARTPYF